MSKRQNKINKLASIVSTNNFARKIEEILKGTALKIPETSPLSTAVYSLKLFDINCHFKILEPLELDLKNKFLKQVSFFKAVKYSNPEA